MHSGGESSTRRRCRSEYAGHSPCFRGRRALGRDAARLLRGTSSRRSSSSYRRRDDEEYDRWNERAARRGRAHATGLELPLRGGECRQRRNWARESTGMNDVNTCSRQTAGSADAQLLLADEWQARRASVVPPDTATRRNGEVRLPLHAEQHRDRDAAATRTVVANYQTEDQKVRRDAGTPAVPRRGPSVADRGPRGPVTTWDAERHTLRRRGTPS